MNRFCTGLQNPLPLLSECAKSSVGFWLGGFFVRDLFHVDEQHFLHSGFINTNFEII